jgi:hypothetical protein
MTRSEIGELAWKWILRLAGIAAFVYILVARAGDVPVGTYVIIGGLIGLPNVISLQSALNQRATRDPDGPA